MKYVIGNWKSHKNNNQAVEWFEAFLDQYSPQANTTVVVAVNFVALEAVASLVNHSQKAVFIATQNISPYPYGAYTGEVTAGMIKEYANYCIIGHSERRKYFAESNQQITNKVTQLLESEIVPILCVDEPYAKEQILQIEPDQFEKIIVAYEPLGAIGSGQAQPESEIIRNTNIIRQYLPASTPVLYGGSVTQYNAHQIINLEGVSGLLVGGASLETESFLKILGQSV